MIPPLLPTPTTTTGAPGGRATSGFADRFAALLASPAAHPHAPATDGDSGDDATSTTARSPWTLAATLAGASTLVIVDVPVGVAPSAEGDATPGDATTDQALADALDGDTEAATVTGVPTGTSHGARAAAPVLVADAEPPPADAAEVAPAQAGAGTDAAEVDAAGTDSAQADAGTDTAEIHTAHTDAGTDTAEIHTVRTEAGTDTAEIHTARTDAGTDTAGTTATDSSVIDEGADDGSAATTGTGAPGGQPRATAPGRADGEPIAEPATPQTTARRPAEAVPETPTDPPEVPAAAPAAPQSPRPQRAGAPAPDVAAPTVGGGGDAPAGGSSEVGEPAAPETSGADPSAAARRVADAIEALRTAPPPRRITVDLGELRLAVTLRPDGVHVTSLTGTQLDPTFLRSLGTALDNRGLSLADHAPDHQGGGQRRDGRPEHPDTPAPSVRTLRASRPAGGLRL